MNILTVCYNGSVRSVAMAYVIKTVYGKKHDVLASGVNTMSSKTREMLFDWADKIIFMDRETVFNRIDLKDDLNHEKYIILGVGKDHAHDPKEQGLLHKCLKELQNLGL